MLNIKLSFLNGRVIRWIEWTMMMMMGIMRCTTYDHHQFIDVC